MDYFKKIFICYAKEDLAIAKRLYDDLKRQGLNLWLDDIDLKPGQDWDTEIKHAIKNSSYFLALLSSNSVSKRGYVQKELKIAMEVFKEFPAREVFIIPIRLDDCKPRDDELQNLHWADLFPSYYTGLFRVLSVLSPGMNEEAELKPRVLFIDPTYEGVTPYFSSLKRKDIEPSLARNGDEAVEFLAKYKFDLIVMETKLDPPRIFLSRIKRGEEWTLDWTVYREAGITLLGMIRKVEIPKMKTPPDVNVIVLTSALDNAILRRMEQLGVNEIIRKPAPFKVVLNQIESMIFNTRNRAA